MVSELVICKKSGVSQSAIGLSSAANHPCMRSYKYMETPILRLELSSREPRGYRFSTDTIIVSREPLCTFTATHHISLHTERNRSRSAHSGRVIANLHSLQKVT
jgi:hypothetical protein